ncbi:hypothetical protein [Chitinilyticum litopenaei]|uniref:hypothetical protein n=1 Tax=Chitinilyticum litopenaei TaxID=1121276 RepID=UPI001184D5AD|nr:hypothetical protein [Chitinilyticum litopenaei]
MLPIKTSIKNLGNDLVQSGYVPLYGLWDSGFYGWGKMLSQQPIVCSYVHAYTSKQDGQHCDMIIGQIEELDNSWISSPYALGLEVAENWDKDKEFFDLVSKKIQNTEPSFTQLQHAIIAELSNPSHICKRGKNPVREDNLLLEKALLEAAIHSGWHADLRTENLALWGQKNRVNMPCYPMCTIKILQITCRHG